MEQVVYAEEMRRAGAPGTLNPLGLSNIAPAIMATCAPTPASPHSQSSSMTHAFDRLTDRASSSHRKYVICPGAVVERLCVAG